MRHSHIRLLVSPVFQAKTLFFEISGKKNLIFAFLQGFRARME